MPIRIFQEDISYKLSNLAKIKQWIKFTVLKEGFEVGEISYIFCTDPFLLELNKKYLKHKTLTDIITFDYSEQETTSADVFISIDRIKENAIKFGVKPHDEMLRVMIHGILHLMGYSDKSKSEKSVMKEKEDEYLSLWKGRFHVKHLGR